MSNNKIPLNKIQLEKKKNPAALPQRLTAWHCWSLFVLSALSSSKLRSQDLGEAQGVSLGDPECNECSLCSHFLERLHKIMYKQWWKKKKCSLGSRRRRIWCVMIHFCSITQLRLIDFRSSGRSTFHFGNLSETTQFTLTLRRNL